MDSQLPPAREIPAAFTASVRSWWHVGEKESAISEERLLRRLSFFRSASQSQVAPSDPVVATSSRVQLTPANHYINTFSMRSTAPSSAAPPPAVVLHGYGAGLGFFFHNFPPLADWAGRHGSSVFALDWLGMGRSARVPFSVKAKKDNVQSRVAEAESFFIDSLEDWRTKMSLNKMTLIGHSLGAYFSVAYALKYPDRVHKLILLSPAGVPRGPNYEEPSRELTDEPPNVSTDSKTSSNERSTFHRATDGRVKSIRQEQKENKTRESKTRRLFTYLWEEGWSPFQLVRSTFVWGPMLIGKYSSRRFSGLTEEETRDMHDYIMNITLAKGSGEYCISHILEPGAHARMPLVDRIAALPKDMQVTFVYGDHDWMDPVGGQESVKRLRKVGNDNGRMYIISNAGHHVYLDNKDEVNALLVKELERQ
ncbi:putative cardiolipin-specific deacylase, mitochondrial [Psilocybe cubensis]|uniref:Cardiolipin-specific deacylase, mitochondrial n=2 Tax=Psilocybe cubensis TaxID=181762 RepID=A0ACB8H4M1_PSICU|nr:putative cardiolipin-specific deacylase, mitochondrial [Psilocybe cubensis]KAH9482592.1 putative cardiolipin-specific deacylase, mitochondrial [Psilocybe cubensis]